MLLKLLIKEEWRIHSSLFGNFLFALFPLFLLGFSFFTSLSIPTFTGIVKGSVIATVSHYVFLLFGVSVGGFGLFGKEAMNRRFGQASLLAYSSRSLPISERRIFFEFLLKDVLFYFALWILPMVGGMFFAFAFLGMAVNTFLVFLTLSLSFLSGLSVVFLLSTIYAHSNKIMVLLFVLIVIFSGTVSGTGLSLLPPLSLYFNPGYANLFSSLLLVLVPASISIAFIKVDYPQKKRHLKNILDPLSRKIGTGYSQFVAKDFLDLDRSEGGLGKIIFSFLFPLMILWVLLSVFLKFLPETNFLVIFSIFLGIISSSIYNWLTEFDLFSAYAFLPIKVSYVIKSKIVSYAILNTISVCILFISAAFSNSLGFLLPAFCSYLFTSVYAMSVVVYLTGLRPNVLLYNAWTFALYICSCSPVILVLIFLSVWNPFSLLLTALFLPLPVFVLKKSFIKWDEKDFQSF